MDVEEVGIKKSLRRAKMSSLRQTPLTCSGHTRPVVHLAFSDVTESGYYLISACKGKDDSCLQWFTLALFLVVYTKPEPFIHSQ